MRKWFLIHGIPEIVESDNGPPFNVDDFKHFAKQFGFMSSPIHPKSNGLAERYRRIIQCFLNTTELAKYSEG